MKYRGWKYRCYADEPETPVADFVCAFLGGAMGFFNFPGWLLVYFGWLNTMATLLLCLAVGLALGAHLLFDTRAEKNKCE